VRDHAPSGFIRDQMQRSGIPGLSVAIVRNGATQFARSYGLNDIELQIPATNATAFQIASVTKVLTSVAIGALVDDGLVALESPVAALLPSVPVKWSAMQVHHLLEHTSGLPRGAEAHSQFVTESRARRDRGHFVDAAKLDFFTGSEFARLFVRTAPSVRAWREMVLQPAGLHPSGHDRGARRW
jgi:CubicO group peptidase (beta-lactamase class C family)